MEGGGSSDSHGNSHKRKLRYLPCSGNANASHYFENGTAHSYPSSPQKALTEGWENMLL